MEGVSGVGVSFGADRIYDVIHQLDRFPERGEMDTKVLFVNFGEKEVVYILPVLDKLRFRAIASELYPESAKMKKQMSYANNRSIPFVALVGEQEMADGLITLKEMETGKQERLTPDQLVERLSQ
jgi:histidyl-tRNA synthetase